MAGTLLSKVVFLRDVYVTPHTSAQTFLARDGLIEIVGNVVEVTRGDKVFIVPLSNMQYGEKLTAIPFSIVEAVAPQVTRGPEPSPKSISRGKAKG